MRCLLSEHLTPVRPPFSLMGGCTKIPTCAASQKQAPEFYFKARFNLTPVSYASMVNGVGVVQQRLRLIARADFLHFDFVPSLDGG